MNKPEITATIKFRGVTIEGMTVEELRQLRDLLNELVGPKVTERVIEHHEYPSWHPHWWYTASYSTDQAFLSGVSLSQSSGEIVIDCVSIRE